MNESDLHTALKKSGLTEHSLPAELVKRCAEFGFKISVAESCTGGIISAKITDVAGASNIFDCGVCSYANSIKHKLLGVKESTLILNGAVSPQTALQMAKGVKKLACADIGVSVTGIAGPSGGTDKKPVGLVYIGISAPFGTYAVKCLWNNTDSRAQIREYSAVAALYFAFREVCKGSNL